MSALILESVRPEERLAHGLDHHGIRPYAAEPGASRFLRKATSEGEGHEVTTNDSRMEQDISAGQKMLSAVSGSLLTSLLGESSGGQ